MPEHKVRLTRQGVDEDDKGQHARRRHDTAKDKLDIAVHGRPVRLTVENRPPGWRRLIGELGRAGVGRVGIEATGGSERGVTARLRAAGFTVVLLQPPQVKAYAELHLRRGKNDALDAMLLAACTAAIQSEHAPPDPRLAPLADALTYVEQIEEDIARWRTRLQHITDPRLRRLALADIKRLKARREAELRRIATAVRRHDDLARRLDLLLSIPGIGDRTALALLLRMPELGNATREQAAALVGLAPFDDDSGKHDGQRHIAGGRARLRHSLYAAALPGAFRWNPALILLYQRLTAKGKAHKLALIACARKLLLYANAVLHPGTPWTKIPAAT